MTAGDRCVILWVSVHVCVLGARLSNKRSTSWKPGWLARVKANDSFRRRKSELSNEWTSEQPVTHGTNSRQLRLVQVDVIWKLCHVSHGVVRGNYSRGIRLWKVVSELQFRAITRYRIKVKILIPRKQSRSAKCQIYIYQRIRFAAAPDLYVNFAVYRYSRRDVDFNSRRTLRHISFLDARYTNDSPFVKFIYVWSENPTIQTWRARAGIVICFQWAERYYVSLSNQIRWFWRMNVTALLVASIT